MNLFILETAVNELTTVEHPNHENHEEDKEVNASSYNGSIEELHLISEELVSEILKKEEGQSGHDRHLLIM
jgi:hypothetical protein